MQSYPSASMPRNARLVLAALLLGVVGYGATTLPGSANSASSALGHWLYPSLMSAQRPWSPPAPGLGARNDGRGR